MLTILNPVHGHSFAVGLDRPLLGAMLCCRLCTERLEKCLQCILYKYIPYKGGLGELLIEHFWKITLGCHFVTETSPVLI